MYNNIYSLYLVTNQFNFDEESFLKIIEEACMGGISTLQLRDKDISDQEFIRLGKKVKNIVVKYNVSLILNDRAQLLDEINADGVHLGQSDENPILIREKLGSNKIIGLSLETIEDIIQLKRNAQILQSIDYVAVSPIFYTKTKLDIKTPLGIEGLIFLKNEISTHPIIAIGGIDEGNLSEVIINGADGIALTSAIMKSSNPKEKTKNLKDIINENLSKSS